MATAPWRLRLRPASFRGVEFHVELGARSGGRRLAPHEFPKRDLPYTEDMGRKGRGFPITAYVIGPDYQYGRDRLIDALEKEGPGTLVHPTLGEFIVNAGLYSCTERRERGGYCEFEMTFLETGDTSAFTIDDATQDQIRAGAQALQNAIVSSGTTALEGTNV